MHLSKYLFFFPNMIYTTHPPLDNDKGENNIQTNERMLWYIVYAVACSRSLNAIYARSMVSTAFDIYKIIKLLVNYKIKIHLTWAFFFFAMKNKGQAHILFILSPSMTSVFIFIGQSILVYGKQTVQITNKYWWYEIWMVR
jgi:hypothetical protein